MSEKTDIPVEYADDMLAAEFALGLLQGAELDSARGKMVADRNFARLVADWQECLVAMTDGVDPVKPSRKARRALLKRLFPEPKVPLSQRVWVWKGASFAALLMAGYLGLQVMGPQGGDGTEPIFAAQLASENNSLHVMAVMDPIRGGVALHRVAGGAKPGRSLELWAILPDQAPISLGTLPIHDRGRLLVPDNLLEHAAKITFAISDEPLGGSPTGSPTGDVLAASMVNAL